MEATDRAGYQRPEGKLLADALRRSGRSARRAAGDMGLSDTRLRHIINGYQPVGRGQVIEVVGPAETVAKAAEVLGVTPGDLEKAGRADAAKFLRDAREASALRGTETSALLHLEAVVAELRAFLDGEPFGGGSQAPDSALLLFTEQQLMDEIQRRMEATRALLRELVGDEGMELSGAMREIADIFRGGDGNADAPAGGSAPNQVPESGPADQPDRSRFTRAARNAGRSPKNVGDETARPDDEGPEFGA